MQQIIIPPKTFWFKASMSANQNIANNSDVRLYLDTGSSNLPGWGMHSSGAIKLPGGGYWWVSAQVRWLGATTSTQRATSLCAGYSTLNAVYGSSILVNVSGDITHYCTAPVLATDGGLGVPSIQVVVNQVTGSSIQVAGGNINGVFVTGFKLG